MTTIIVNPFNSHRRITKGEGRVTDTKRFVQTEQSYDHHKDPSILSKMMKRIQQTKDQYYIGEDSVVRIKFNRKWLPYEQVMKIDSRLAY